MICAGNARVVALNGFEFACFLVEDYLKFVSGAPDLARFEILGCGGLG
jgi:hypothetical protein